VGTSLIKFEKESVIPYGLSPVEELPMLQRIEECGRLAWKSEYRGPDATLPFVQGLINKRHFSVLEHGNICFSVEGFPALDHFIIALSQGGRSYYHPIYIRGSWMVISGNLRAWIETLWYLRENFPHFDRLLRPYFCEHYPNIFGQYSGDYGGDLSAFEILYPASQLAIQQSCRDSDLPVFTFRIVTNRGISHELVRHRTLSFTQESTRYVRYDGGKMTFILPAVFQPFWNQSTGLLDTTTMNRRQLGTLDYYDTCARQYDLDLLDGIPKGDARDGLQHHLKTEIFISGRWFGWRNFIWLRNSKAAHWRAYAIAEQIHEYFLSIGLDAYKGDEYERYLRQAI